MTQKCVQWKNHSLLHILNIIKKIQQEQTIQPQSLSKTWHSNTIFSKKNHITKIPPRKTIHICNKQNKNVSKEKKNRIKQKQTSNSNWNSSQHLEKVKDKYESKKRISVYILCRLFLRTFALRLHFQFNVDTRALHIHTHQFKHFDTTFHSKKSS